MLRPIDPSRPRRRLPLAAVGFAVLMLAATACHQDNTPQFYNSVTKDNFVQGCIGGSTGTTLASPDLCQCLYTQVTAIVPASNDDRKANPKKYAGYDGLNFQQLNSAVKSDPRKVPTEVQDAWEKNCSSKGYVGTTSTTSASSGGGPTTTKG